MRVRDRSGNVFQRLTLLVLFALAATGQPARAQAVDDARVQSAGIRKVASRHLVLYTDLPSQPDVDRLPAEFDQAVPQWAAYFDIDASRTTSWQSTAFLIGERRRFDALGLMPVGNDQFVNGISIGDRLWFYDQPTAYYRRHLLLHEGTHAFMANFLGGCGPGWFMEGTAELLATHRLDDATGRVALGIMPHDRGEVPMLGRIKLIQDARAAGRTLSLPAVMQISNHKQLENEPYAWCWAAAKFLDAHPRYRARFRQLKRHVKTAEFNDLTRREFHADWDDLLAEWQAFIATLDHGFDFERMPIDFTAGRPLRAASTPVTIAVDRGWQSTGVQLQAGTTYALAASGRYQIADDGQPWLCEPGGVTIEYYDGKPLGMLLGAVDGRSPGCTLADAFRVGLGTTITPSATGTLYLRVNDSPGRLHDNSGTLTATITRLNGGTERRQ